MSFAAKPTRPRLASRQPDNRLERLSPENPEAADTLTELAVGGVHVDFDVSRALRKLRFRYLADQSPLHVWEAVRLARSGGGALPDWVLPYLTKVAEALRQLRDRRVSKGEIDAALVQAFGFKEKGRLGNVNPLRDSARHEFQIALEVVELLNNDYTKVTGAVHRAAELHADRCDHDPRCTSITAAKVMRCWRVYSAQRRPRTR